MIDRQPIAVIIPALNEESTIGKVVDAIPDWVDVIFVCNNGSSDNTARVAAEHGAQVVEAPRRGYGTACLAGLSEINSRFSTERYPIVVFLDADLSDDPCEMHKLVDPIIENKYDFVLGSRTLGKSEPGSLTVAQRYGNALSCRLIKWLFNVQYTDFGPFRAIRWSSLQKLKLDDPDYGWTLQMQVRAARLHLRTTEVPVNYRKRKGGRSKVTRTTKGVVRAGTTMLRVIFSEAADSYFFHRSKS